MIKKIKSWLFRNRIFHRAQRKFNSEILTSFSQMDYNDRCLDHRIAKLEQQVDDLKEKMQYVARVH